MPLTFAITLRPRNGINDTQVEVITSWIKKHSTYYYVITEKLNEERHVHAAVILKKEILRSNLCTALLRLDLGLCDDEKPVFRTGIKSMYNKDFITKYMSKGDDTVVIAENLPESAHLDSYFTLPVPKKGPSAVDPFYANLEKLWWVHQSPGFEINTVNCRDFLFNLQYNLRLIKVLPDDKKIIQVARHLTRYLKKEKFSTIKLPPFEEEE
jgi:hypothetical protein